MGLVTISIPVVYDEDNSNYQNGFLKREHEKGKQLLSEYYNAGFHVVTMSSAVLHDVLWNSYVLERNS